MFQEVCKEKMDWDTIVPPKTVELWDKFVECLKLLPEIRYPCFILHHTEKVTPVQLHGFCATPKAAYCAAIHVRQITSVGIHVRQITSVGIHVRQITSAGIHVRLLTTKTKVAPLTNITIPRLELLSGLLLVELLDVVKRVINCIDISSIYCWSDSEIALYWDTWCQQTVESMGGTQSV